MSTSEAAFPPTPEGVGIHADVFMNDTSSVNPLTVAREAAGLSIPELAKKSGVKRKKIEELEAGRDLPSEKIAARLQSVLGDKVAHLEMALLHWPGFYPPWFAEQDAEQQETARQLESDLTAMADALNSGDSEAEVREVALGLVAAAQRLLVMWQGAADAKERTNAAIFIEAAENVCLAAWDVAQLCGDVPPPADVAELVRITDNLISPVAGYGT